MSCQNIFHDTRDLPSNVLTFVDDTFYQFVEQYLGVYQSMLLKIQEINSVPCFLLTNDPCEILNLNVQDDDLNLLKTKISFALSDGSFIVKPGIKTGFICLRDLLSKKTEEKLKQTRNVKPLSKTNIPISNTSVSPSSTPTRTIVSLPPSTTDSSSPDVTSTPIAEHRRYFFNLLTTWCLNHADEFMSDTFNLNEGTDFILNVLYNQNNDLQASVRCNCGRLITLTLKDEKIQLSNFQKHLRSTNCSHIKAIKKLNMEQKRNSRRQLIDAPSISSSIPLNQLPPTQQSAQAADSVMPGLSSDINVPSEEDMQSKRSQTNARKRGDFSSQSSSRKKRRRI